MKGNNWKFENKNPAILEIWDGTDYHKAEFEGKIIKLPISIIIEILLKNLNIYEK